MIFHMQTLSMILPCTMWYLFSRGGIPASTFVCGILIQSFIYIVSLHTWIGKTCDMTTHYSHELLAVRPGWCPPSVPHSNLVHDTSTRMLALPHVGEVVRSKKEQRMMRYILLLLRSEECEPWQPSEPAVRTTVAQWTSSRKQCGDMAIKNNVLRSTL